MKQLKEKIILKCKIRIETTEECIENFSLSDETKKCLDSEISFLKGIIKELKL
tara:strand:+ start:315 stop:473 length:159 start_codon:yes stop_codon:yes gene_type:complete